jgi:hypothetical protein
MVGEVKKLDWDLLNGLLQRGARLTDCAELLKCSKSIIEKKIRKQYQLSFGEYRDSKLSVLRMKLIDKAIDSALVHHNTAMLIFCLKNICKWTDKQEIDHTSSDLSMSPAVSTTAIDVTQLSDHEVEVLHGVLKRREIPQEASNSE